MIEYNPATCPERLGKLTASKAGIIMGALNTAGLATYVKTLAWERVYGARDPEYQNDAMKRGIEMEPLALDWFEFETGVELKRTPGFIQHPTIAYVGASPDALVLDFGAPSRTVQAKCPGFAAWMETKRTGDIPSEYRHQCRWEPWVAGLSDCQFFTWHPMSGGIIVPISVTESECAQMAERAEIVNAVVEKWVAILQDRSEA